MSEANYTEQDYFDGRSEDYAYVSKAFNGLLNFSYEKRFVQKKFNFSEELRFEKTRIKGEHLLRSSPSNKLQLKVILTQDSHEIDSIIIQNFNGLSPQPESVSFKKGEFARLLEFLEKVKFIDLGNKDKFRIREGEIDTAKILVDEEEFTFIEALRTVHGEKRTLLLEALSNEQLTKEDLDILSGRKKGLELFRQNLFENSFWGEKEWQNFLNENTWIFGYGLDYRFLSILQKEAIVSNTDLDGKNSVKADFLTGTSMFTVLVELKRPDTSLFTHEKIRSECWGLSQSLTNAVSQILSQKAEWEIKSKSAQFDSSGQLISQTTADPRTILIIGSSSEFNGDSKNDLIKSKTFELFRRNSRNIEIITYTELYERAYFIVNQSQWETSLNGR